MRYVFLAYADEKQSGSLSSAQREALGDACLDNDAALRQSGHLLSAVDLQTGCGAATVRLQDGALLVTDGSVAAAERQLIAIFTIDARDLNQAIQLAATMPQALVGPIVVQPIAELR